MSIEILDPKENIVVKCNKTESINSFSYSDFIKNPVGLNKLKVLELKSIAKQYKLHVSGTKPILLERLILNFTRVSKTVLIQRVYQERYHQ